MSDLGESLMGATITGVTEDDDRIVGIIVRREDGTAILLQAESDDFHYTWISTKEWRE